ncbi:coiled-coil domain-containing protein 15 isoform X1 [Heterocephalus glaber]|uniref:Coiled-coil domain-containing protein 15 isoform X1 n=1 Tax=Heterocephalus glaber TaxID=10181 RepID=A0AAX6SEI8_HETGA|nr:coiled-coil domain-containing protein 15 isoform X1 [Heterocephalus glaber]XP_021107581.1 coiled-coil domain-containing protein 15 isoform X1 [Heterocephalus glaber]
MPGRMSHFKKHRNKTNLPLALNPMKSKDVLAVLAERNQAVVPVGAWVEPASPNSSEIPAYTSACIIEEELKEQSRRKEEALKHFQRQVKHRVNQQIRLRKKQQLQKSYEAAEKEGSIAMRSFDPAHLTPKRTSVFPSNLNAAFGSSRLPPSQMLRDAIEDGENQNGLFQQKAQALSQTMKLAHHRLASFKTVSEKMSSVFPNGKKKTSPTQEKVKFKNPLFVVMEEKEQNQWHCHDLQNILPEAQGDLIEVQSVEPETQSVEPDTQAINLAVQSAVPEGQAIKTETQSIMLRTCSFKLEDGNIELEAQDFLPTNQAFLPKDNCVSPKGQYTLHNCQDQNFLHNDQYFLLRNQHVYSREQDILFKCQDENFLPNDQDFLHRDQCVLPKDQNILPKCQDQDFLPEHQGFLPRDQYLLPQNQKVLPKCRDQDFLPEGQDFLPRDQCVLPQNENILPKCQDQDFLPKGQEFLSKDHSIIPNCQDQDFLPKDQSVLPKGQNTLYKCQKQDFPPRNQEANLKPSAPILRVRQGKEELPLDVHQDLFRHDQASTRDKGYKYRSGLSTEFQASLAIHSGVDQEEEKKEHQKQYLRHRRLFMDIEREQIKEQKQQKEQKKKTEKIKKKKEQWYVEEQRIMRMRSHGAPYSEEKMSDSLGQLQLEEIKGAREKQQQREKEYVRYVEALRVHVQEKMKLYNITLPPLCFCGPDFWDAHPDTCANNCIFYKNHKAYNQALYSVISSSDVSEGNSALRSAIHNFASAHRWILKNL